MGPGLEGRTLPAGEESAAQFLGKALRKNFEIGGAKNCAIFCAFLVKANKGLYLKSTKYSTIFCTPNFNVFELRFLVAHLRVEVET